MNTDVPLCRLKVREIRSSIIIIFASSASFLRLSDTVGGYYRRGGVLVSKSTRCQGRGGGGRSPRRETRSTGCKRRELPMQQQRRQRRVCLCIRGDHAGQLLARSLEDRDDRWLATATTDSINGILDRTPGGSIVHRVRVVIATGFMKLEKSIVSR